MGRYTEAFRRSIEDPEGFWGDAVPGIDWYREPAVVLDRSSPPFYRWFSGGTLNTCFNAVDRHVRDGRGDQAALIYDSPVTGTGRSCMVAATCTLQGCGSVLRATITFTGWRLLMMAGSWCFRGRWPGWRRGGVRPGGPGQR